LTKEKGGKQDLGWIIVTEEEGEEFVSRNPLLRNQEKEKKQSRGKMFLLKRSAVLILAPVTGISGGRSDLLR